MLKTHWRLISRLERVGDNILVTAMFFAAYYFRDVALNVVHDLALVYPREAPALGAIDQYLVVLGVGLPLYNASLSILGAYRSMRFSTYYRIFRLCFVASCLVFVAQGSILYLLKLDLSRSFVATFCALCGVALFLERVCVLEYLRFWRARGRNYRNLLIAGVGAQARRVFHEIVQSPELGIRVVGFASLSDESRMLQEQNGGVLSSEVYDLSARVIATPANFETALKRYAIDEVLFTDIVSSLEVVEDLAQIAIEEGVRVTMAADLFSLGIIRSDTSYFGAIPLIHYEPAPVDTPALVVKRCIDVVVSSILLLLLSPLLLLVAVLVKATSPGPVFFRQRRMGLNGRTFVLLKFRSMVEGAEQMLPELKARNEMSGPVFKLKDDPRVTRIGRWLRRTSIDELPQLINVLLGDMSLVGPRPPLPDEVSLYERKQRRRLSMRPGLTCIWQVSGRNEIPDFEEWAKLDLEYIDNWSLTTDLKLLLRTIPVVLSGTGAR